MIKYTWLLLLLMSGSLYAQDTTIAMGNQAFTLSEVVVRNNFDYKQVLETIKQDTTFYKAFRNLELYAGLFFTKGQICGENNIVKGRNLLTSNKSGIEKHKDQLKMLFFNPGKKIPGIPFIGDKLDLYDEAAHKLYDYRLDVVDYKGTLCYLFSIKPKEDLGFLKSDRVVVDQMNTWFDLKTLEVLGRNYALSYKAGVYDFDVAMEVEMTKFNGLTVPKTLRYKGNWDVVFKKRERAIFTATLFDYN